MRPLTTVARALIGIGIIAGVVLLVSGCPEEPSREAEVVTPPEVSAPPPTQEDEPMEPGVIVKYFGHACFVVTDSNGMSVAIDPYDKRVGYDVPSLSAEICLVTHDHFDHSNTDAVSGDPEIVTAEGDTEANAISIVGVKAAHHEPGENEERGDVIMFRWTMDDLNIIHVSDLGTPLAQEQIDALGPADVLLVPVGGHFTIDAAQAVEVAGDLQAKFVIPMHYKTDATDANLPIAAVDDFLDAVPDDWNVTQLDSNSITIDKSEVEKEGAPTRVVVLGYQ